MFPHFAENHSELPPEERQNNDSIVFDGAFVSDQSWDAAVFEELASLASLMWASKVFDILNCHKGWAILESDAQQAYMQSERTYTEP